MLTLYEHPFALYCQKVLIALNDQGIAYNVLVEQRDFDRANLIWRTVAARIDPGAARRRPSDR